MTLPSSGTITMNQIQDEFGAPRGTPLLAFYRGGAWVANTGANAGVPTSGSITLPNNFYGASRVGPLFAGSVAVNGATHSGTSNDLIGNGSINASGGTPPYSYNTVYLSGTSFTLSGTTTAFPAFRRTGNPPGGGTVSGTYRCTVTDSASQQVTTDFTVTDTRT